MRMSCNGCRVLRKGCSENCSIRPCLQWIKTPESQANATVFLAKFYGRAGLMNLINSGPEHLRPAIFRSLLYEACGRIVNPIYGSVGLLWSGSWQLCQSAVEAVLKGAPIMQIPSEAAVSPTLPFKAYDIRHVTKDESSAASQELHKVKTRTRFKRTGGLSASMKLKPKSDSATTELISEPTVEDSAVQLCNMRWNRTTHESSASQQSEPNGETESMFSVETVEASMVSRAEPAELVSESNETGIELELTLGFEPSRQSCGGGGCAGKASKKEMNGSDSDKCKMELGLDYPI